MADDAARTPARCRAGSPGTSSKVTSGMLKASQKRTKRAPFTEASMSRQPARTAGWLATMPTLRPPKRAKPTTMLGAKCACTSRKRPSSTTASMSVLHVVGLAGLGGDQGVEGRVLAVRRGRRSCASGGSSRLFGGQVGEQLADEGQAGAVVVHREVGDARLRVVGHGAAQVLLA